MKSRFETASIEFSAIDAESQVLGHGHPAGVEVDARQRARAQGEVLCLVQAELEPLEVAPQLPEVGEQVVREVDGLRPLQMGVAGHRPIQVRGCLVCQHMHELQHALARVQGVGPHEHRQIGGHLVVARARGVHLAPHRPDDLREAPLDGHVDVLVVRANLERVLVDLLPHRLEPALDLCLVLGRDDRAAPEHPDVRKRLLDVVGGEPVVEGDRAVQRVERGVPRLGEAV
jgi:hypothetical protein